MEWAASVLVLPHLKWKAIVGCCSAQTAVIAAAEVVDAAEVIGAVEVAGTSAAAKVEGEGASDCMMTETTVNPTCTGQSQRMKLNLARRVPACDAPAV